MRRASGFTLIEIMIVTAIIGILAAIAIPNWSNMIAKSRQVEAREGLDGIFALETAYHGEHNRFGNIVEIGFVAQGAGRYSYCVGDPSDTGSCISGMVEPVTIGAGPGGPVRGLGGGHIEGDDSPDAGGGGSSNLNDDDDSSPGGGNTLIGNPHADGNSFEADAYGHISKATAPHDTDIWMMDQRKLMMNVRAGY